MTHDYENKKEEAKNTLDTEEDKIIACSKTVANKSDD